MGRPSSFTQETADAICERMAEGESLRSICSDEAMPARTTVRRWLDENEDFRSRYARARDERTDHFADEILEISDEGDDEDVQSRRLQVDTRKWLMARMAPKKYGDKVAVEASGPDGAPLVPQSFRVEFVKPEDADADKG